MTKHTIETVTFKLAEGVTKDAFLQTVSASTQYIQGRSGFIARRLSCSDDGTWIEQIEWETMADAKGAAANLGSADSIQPFLQAINETSVTMHHSTVEVSLN